VLLAGGSSGTMLASARLSCFEQLVSYEELICAMVQNFSKIGQMVLDYRNFLILKMVALKFLNF